MKRLYELTWGAQVLDCGMRFRLWAPAAQSVSLVLCEPGGSIQPMQRGDAGWFELEQTNAACGTRYLYEIDGGLRVPDPASRFQPDGIEGPSMVVDPRRFEWPEADFQPRPFPEAVIYELHVGTFTREGTYAAAARRLDHLAELGVDAIEIMPLSQAPGTHNWGYDGVLHYAPAHYYGTPDDLKRFIVAAHERGLAVLLDVVYNHFGPRGNYLPHYAPQFFSARLKTPWGAGIDYASPGNDPVRRYAIENACYWVVEYGFDGLRLDATPMIFDTRPVHVLDELLDEVKRTAQKPVYLIAEDVKNEIVERVRAYDGRWSDDPHDALHVLLTGDPSPYYGPFRSEPLQRMMHVLAAEGVHLVEFLQNHDQVGNRPFGDRISALAPGDALRAAIAILLLAPAVPLLFMGEEWGASTPFLFFCDFEPELAKRVTAGRRAEFSQLAEFSDPAARSRIPDPAAIRTFLGSKLQWDEIDRREHRNWLQYYRELLGLRRKYVAPFVRDAGKMEYRVLGKTGAVCSWSLGNSKALMLDANIGAAALAGLCENPRGRVIFATHGAQYHGGLAPPWSVRWTLGERPAE